jgi:hypothetical protein
VLESTVSSRRVGATGKRRLVYETKALKQRGVNKVYFMRMEETETKNRVADYLLVSDMAWLPIPQNLHNPVIDLVSQLTQVGR